MKTSPEINELAAALSAAQGEFTAAERAHVARIQSDKGERASYSYSYADLAAYLDVCREPLAKHGLAFVQSPKVNGKLVSVTTTLLHSSGQFIESDPLEMTAADDGPQKIGSILTYCRRYSLSAVIGMASEADDDGHSGSGTGGQTERREDRPPLPACPKCGTNKSVIVGKPEYGGGYVCFAKKGGCGAKWQDPAATAQQLAAEHGMTTGDKIPPKAPEVPMYDQLKAKLESLKSDDPDVRAKIDTAVEFIEAQAKKGTITQPQKSDLAFMVMEIQKEVDSLQAA